MVLIEGKNVCTKYNRDIDRQLQDDMAKAKNLNCVKLSDNPYIGARLKCGGCEHNKYFVFRDGVIVGDHHSDFMGEVIQTASIVSQHGRDTK